MEYKDSSKYEGWWINDKKEGMGKMSYANRQVEYGLWKEDKLDTGLLVFKDGSYVYKGDWKQKFGTSAFNTNRTHDSGDNNSQRDR